MFEWDAALYSRFLKERTQPAVDLAVRIDLKEPRTAIDIGCGPGNSTKVLADRFPGIRVTGADISQNMIALAKRNYPEMEFISLDASKDLAGMKERYDIVFSSACIQWIPDHRRLIPGMMGILKAGGVLAVQMPDNYFEPIHLIIRDVADSAKWRDQLADSRQRELYSEEDYFDILSGQTGEFSLWRTVYMHRMPSHESIMDWYRGTGMRPYLDRLNETDAAEYEKDVLAEVRKAYPVQPNGEILFRFPRLFFTAKKV
ncbi:MAG: trans-aconitate methyltransferase [Clostridiales bacterium]|nr:trans-aconitate methyltransferase [Clostridiales bacterium]